MKALVLESDKRLEYKEVPLPENRDKAQVLVRVKYAGICGSDIHRGFEGGAYHYPLVMGHEFSGVVEEAAMDGNFKSGEQVVIYPLLPCGKCIPCQTGDFAQCSDYDYYGSRRDGGFAEYVYVPEANLFRVPEGRSLLHAAMTEPCSVALHGVRKLSIKAGDIGAVYGGGPIGNITAQWMRLAGCKKVFVVDIDDTKLQIASDMGFETINSRQTDPVDKINSLTAGNGADKVVEACGLPATFRQSVLSAARSGEIVFMGNIGGDFILKPKDFTQILRRELTIRGTWNSKVTPYGKDEWTTVLSYLGNGLDVAPLISHMPQLSEGAAFFNDIAGKKKFFNKVIFQV